MSVFSDYVGKLKCGRGHWTDEPYYTLRLFFENISFGQKVTPLLLEMFSA